MKTEFKVKVGQFKGALAKIFFQKILRLKVEGRLGYVIYVTLKQTTLILKTFPWECILNRVVIYICLQEMNNYVY